jgi:hypothetical protein
MDASGFCEMASTTSGNQRSLQGGTVVLNFPAAHSTFDFVSDQAVSIVVA